MGLENLSISFDEGPFFGDVRSVRAPSWRRERNFHFQPGTQVDQVAQLQARERERERERERGGRPRGGRGREGTIHTVNFTQEQAPKEKETFQHRVFYFKRNGHRANPKTRLGKCSAVRCVLMEQWWLRCSHLRKVSCHSWNWARWLALGKTITFYPDYVCLPTNVGLN